MHNSCKINLKINKEQIENTWWLIWLIQFCYAWWISLIIVLRVRPQFPSIFPFTEQYSSRLRVLEQNFEQNKRFLRALPTGRIMLNNKNGSEGKCSQCACFWLEIIKGILFGVWDLLQTSFVSGNIYRLREIS